MFGMIWLYWDPASRIQMLPAFHSVWSRGICASMISVSFVKTQFLTFISCLLIEKPMGWPGECIIVSGEFKLKGLQFVWCKGGREELWAGTFTGLQGRPRGGHRAWVSEPLRDGTPGPKSTLELPGPLWTPLYDRSIRCPGMAFLSFL